MSESSQLPPGAVIVRHPVADFDPWKAGFDDHEPARVEAGLLDAADLQESKGIIGHAANQSLDDSNLAVVYHQADSFDTLEAFLADPELRAGMESAGVVSEPEVSYHTGGWAKLY